jgi:SAM-dependent methyltransferase
MQKFILTEEMQKYIKLQRTNLRDNIESRYYKNVEDDYVGIISHLNNYTSVLDIGCGIGGIDYFLGHRNPSAEIYLMDTTGTDAKIYYGYQKRGCFYNSLELAKDFLRDNEVENKITVINVEGKYELPETVDLVISLISWGFHYPIETYLGQVDKILTKDGIIICDIRKGAYVDSVNAFTKLGYMFEVICEREKYLRMKFKK